MSKFFIVLLSFVFAVSAAAAPVSSTDVRFYRPFEEGVEGQMTLEATEISTGTCITHSNIDNRSDAWQCKTGNKTLDPCFIKTYVKTKAAICPVSPWQSQSTVIKLVPPLPPSNTNNQDNLDMSEDDPWAITLVDGTHCLKLSGSNIFAVHGQEVKYSCDNHGFLLGHIQRCDLVWKMLFLVSKESDSMNTVEISTAWY